MRLPWTNKTGMAKATAILATMLIVSFGLCGANFVSVVVFVPFGGGAGASSWRNSLGSVFSVMGVLELVGIAVGIIGLVIIGLTYAIRSLRRPSPVELDDKDGE